MNHAGGGNGFGIAFAWLYRAAFSRLVRTPVELHYNRKNGQRKSFYYNWIFLLFWIFVLFKEIDYEEKTGYIGAVYF